MEVRNYSGTIMSLLDAVVNGRREPQLLKRMFACLLLGVLCVTMSMAQSATIGQNISLSYTEGSFNIANTNFNSSAKSIKVFFDFGEGNIDWIAIAYDRWNAQNQDKRFLGQDNLSQRYHTIIVTNSDIISEMSSTSGISVSYGNTTRTIKVIVTNYDTADGAANDKSEASGIDPNASTGNGTGGTGGTVTPPSTATLADKIKNHEQLTNIPTIYLTVPDALNADGTAKDINSVLFKTGNVAEYHAATIQVVDNSGQLENFTDNKLEIKVRGNSTAGDDKKPYRLKFAKDTKDAAGKVIETHKHDLLGTGFTTGPKRNWTLLTNHKDASLLHNALTYHVGKAVDMDFCPGYRFVDLVINGEYRGNYQISDHVEVGKNRVDVDEDTGWFVEAARSGMEEDPKVYAAGLYMTVKSPDYDLVKQAAEVEKIQADIKKYFDDLNYYWGVYHNNPCSFEDFINPKTGWRAYIDEESLVKFYVGINLTDDYDGFMTVKMYREIDGKLKFGPLWDKDLAYGNWENHGKLCEEYQNGYTFSDHMLRMMTDPYFVKKVYEKLHAVVDAGFISNMQAKIYAMGTEIAASQALNYNKWYTGSDYSAEQKKFANYIEEHTNYVVGRIDEIYDNIDWTTVPTFPDTPDDPDDDDTPTGDLGALGDLGNGKYSYTGSASTFKAGTEITITTSENTSLSNHITEGTAWNTTKTITLTAADVTTLAANSYTFYMNATGGEVKAVTVKEPVTTATGAEFNKEYTSSYTSGDFVVPASNFNANATKIKVILKNNLSNYSNGWNGNYGFNGHPWKAAYSWTTTNTQEITVTDTEDIQSVAQYGMGITGPKDMTITVINYGSSSGSGSSTTPTYALTLSASEGGTVTGAGTYAEGTTVLIKAIPNDGYKFVKWSDDNTYASRSVTLNEAIELTATFAAEGSADDDPFNERGERKQLTNLPTIYLDATVGNEWSRATLEVFDADNKLGQGAAWTKTTADVSVQFQGSGDKNKDSYRLKFEAKTQLLSSGKFKQWVLLANDDDPTMMRNALAKEMGDALGLPFTPGYQFVDLYVNNNYMGTYQVTDRIKVESGRALVTGGNKDLDWHVRLNDAGEYNEDKPTYYIAGTTTAPYIIPKNPDPKDDETTWNSTLKSAMTTYFDNVFAKDASGKYTAFAENVDHQQLIEWYIAQEMLCVYKGFSSIEAYRSVNATDKNLHIGILWDSEKAFGNTGEAPAISMADLNTAGSYNGLMTNYAAYDVMKNIFTQLWQERWFANGVNNLWKEKHEAMLSAMTTKAAALKTELEGSWAQNATKWNITGEQATSIEAMTTWLTARDAYLTKKFATLAAAVPCENHTYENHNYIEQTNGTYLVGCDVCGAIKADSETYYKFTVYPESATTTEVIATSWHPSAEHPNSIAVVEAEKEIVEKIDGYNIVCGKKDANKNLTCKDFRLTDGHPYCSDNKFVATTATYTRNITNAWGTLVLPYKMQAAETDYAKFYHLGEVKTTNGSASTLVFTSINPEVSGDCSAYIPVVFKATDKAIEEGKIVVNGTDVTVKKTTSIDPETELIKKTVDGWSLIGTITQERVKVKGEEYAGGTIYYIGDNKFSYVPLSSSYTSNPFRAYYVLSSSSTMAAKPSLSIGVYDDLATSIIQPDMTDSMIICTGHGSISITSPSDAVVSVYTTSGVLVDRLALKTGVEKTTSVPAGLYVVNGMKVVVNP